jgi:hypothetical protein
LQPNRRYNINGSVQANFIHFEAQTTRLQIEEAMLKEASSVTDGYAQSKLKATLISRFAYLHKHGDGSIL